MVDTNIVSYIFRGDTRAERYRANLDGRNLTVSFMTIAERRSWALGRRWSAQRQLSLNRQPERFTIYDADNSLRQT